MPILTCMFFTCNWLTLTSEIHFVKFHPEVASCLLSRGKGKYVPLGMRLLWKYIRNYFLVYHLTSHFWLYLQNYKEFEAEILDLQIEKYGLSFDIKKCTTSGWAPGDENVIGIRPFNVCKCTNNHFRYFREFSLNFCFRKFLLRCMGWFTLKLCEARIRCTRFDLKRMENNFGWSCMTFGDVSHEILCSIFSYSC